MANDIIIHELEEFSCPWCGREGAVGIMKENDQENVVMIHETPQCPNFIACEDPAHYILGIAPRKEAAS